MPVMSLISVLIQTAYPERTAYRELGTLVEVGIAASTPLTRPLDQGQPNIYIKKTSRFAELK